MEIRSEKKTADSASEEKKVIIKAVESHRRTLTRRTIGVCGSCKNGRAQGRKVENGERRTPRRAGNYLARTYIEKLTLSPMHCARACCFAGFFSSILTGFRCFYIYAIHVQKRVKFDYCCFYIYILCFSINFPVSSYPLKFI